MSDIFLSYARPDKPSAARIAAALEGQGWSVFWDDEAVEDDAYDTVLARELAAASCVVVLWSNASVESDWIREEAVYAEGQSALIPVLIDAVRVPTGFERLQTADLTGWTGEPDHPGLIELTAAVGRVVAKPPTTPYQAQREPAQVHIPDAAAPTAKTSLLSHRTPVIVAAVAFVIGAGALLAVLATRSDDSGDSAATTSAPAAPSDSAPAAPSDSTPPAASTPSNTGEAVGSDGRSGGAFALTAAVVPSAAGMVRVTAEMPLIGYADYATLADPSPYRPEQVLAETFDFWVDERSTSNAFYREWLIYAAGNDVARWSELAPAAWDTSPVTGLPQFADDAGQDPVTGVSWEGAVAYCTYVNKRVVTEIEWELASVQNLLASDAPPVLNWVDASDDYGPVEAGNSVLRGTYGSEDLDTYYRTIGPDNSVFRIPAGLRCAADETRPERVLTEVGTTLYQDDFSDVATAWPSTAPNSLFSVGYHPTDVFHIEAESGFTQVMAVTGEAFPEGSTITSGIELRKPVDDLGRIRYGLAARVSSAGYVLFSVSPVVDDGLTYLDWCLEVHRDVILGSGDRVGARRVDASAERCADGVAGGRVEVESFTNRLSIAFGGPSIMLSIDQVTIDAGPSNFVDLPDGDVGLYLESFDEERPSHIHFDGLLVTG